MRAILEAAARRRWRPEFAIPFRPVTIALERRLGYVPAAPHYVPAAFELHPVERIRAAVDEFGLNGHAPLFHTVNSNGNRSKPVRPVLFVYSEWLIHSLHRGGCP